MEKNSIMIMIGLCVAGILSVLLIIAVTTIRPHLQPILTWMKRNLHWPSRRASSERLIMHYLHMQRSQHITYTHQDVTYTLFMLLNQSEHEFCTIDLDRQPIRQHLEAGLTASLADHQLSGLSSSSINQLPEGHGQLICLALAGFSIAKASFSLLGYDEYARSIHPKIIKKLTSPSCLQSPVRQLLPLLKSANPFPWAMINTALDYWAVNPALLNQLNLKHDLQLDSALIKDVITFGYLTGVRDNLVRHYSHLAA